MRTATGLRAATETSTTMPTPEKIKALRGSCLCGAATYEVPDDFEYSLICHCSGCRRSTGAGAKPFAGIRAAKLVRGTGDAFLHYGGGTNFDVHCRHCGSLLYSIVRERAFAHVTLGTLIDPPSIRPKAHIFVGSKAPWDVICDDLPQHEALPTNGARETDR